jgi:imidazolonepropionase-like amidohydrolase
MRVLRSIAIAALGVALSVPQARAQHSADTARYVMLFSGRPAGFYKEWWSGQELHSVFEYNDRGRGPHQEATMRVGSDGVPTALTIVGHGYLKDTVDERFTNSGGTATWKTQTEHGTRANAGNARYISASESPIGTQLLVRAALANGGHVGLLPNGEATVAKSGDLTITANGAQVHVVRYDLGGLGFSPFTVWTDDSVQHFATVSGWSSIVPAGWEGAIPEMVAAQDKAQADRYVRLAHDLSHKPAGVLAIRGARMFVAESATVRPNTTVLISGNRITAVGADGAVPIPAGATIIEAKGKTLLPGLWDMHVHISPGDDGLLHIAAGVTSARDMGNDTISVLRLQKEFGADSLIGPRLVLAGLIDGSGPYQVPTGLLADDTASALRDVDWYAAHGYEQIKVYSSMKPALVPAIIAEAHAKGLRVSGHVPAFMTAEQVVRLGFDEVQHANMLLLNFMDSVKDTRTMARFTSIGAAGKDLDLTSKRVRDFVALFKARGTDIDPTLVAFEGMFTARPGTVDPSQAAIAPRMPPQVLRGFYGGGLPVPPGMDQRYRDGFGEMMGIVKEMYDAGVPIVAGTDNGPVGFALHRELELYVQTGIPAPKVLQIATIGAARVMHHDNERGSIAVGKLADVVLVDGDPTTNISDVRKTSVVVKDGIVYKPSEIYAVLGVKP